MPTLREVYEKFKAAGAKMPDTYEEFDRFMTSGPNGGYTHRKEFYDKYKAIGAPLPETYEEFSRALFVPALGHGVPTYTEEQVAADLGRSQGGVTLDADAPSAVAPSGQGAGLAPGAGLGADAPRGVAGGSGSVEAGQGPGEGQATRSRRRTLDEVAPPSTMGLLPEGTEGQQGAQARQWAAVSEPGAQAQTPAQAPLAPEEAPVGPPRAQAQAPSELVSDKLYDFRNVVDGAPPTAEQKADASAHVAEVLSDFRSATSKPEPTFVEQMQARGQHTLRPGMAVSRYNPETKQTERVYPAADGRYYGTALQASLATAEYNKPANQVIRDLGAGDTSSLDGLIRDSYQGAVADIKGELSEQLRAAAKKPAISRTGVMGVDPELARAQSDYNAKMTLESLTSRVWSAIPEGVIQAYIRRDVLAALQADPDVSEATLDAIVQHSADGLADRIAKTIWRDADEWAKKEMGSASFVKQALLSTTPALLALGSMGDNIYKQALMQQSQAWGEEHPWQNAGAFAAGMLMDPTMYGYGFAAKGVAGAAIGGLGRRYMIRGLNKYAAERITADVARRYMLMRPLGQVAHKGIAGAANFAMFETGTEAAGQYARGEFDLGKLMLKPVTGAAKGALIGFGGGMVGNAFDKLARGASSTAEALALRAAGTGVSLGVESTVFAGADALLEGEDFGEAWLNAARTIIAMKAVNAAPHAITAVGEGVRNIRAPKTRAQQLSQKSLLQGIADRLANTPEASLTDTELAELKRYGYGDVSELLRTKPSSYREGADGRVEVDGRTYDNLAAMMGDSRVSETARAKMYYICTGKRVPMSTVSGYNIGEREVIGEDGKPTGEKIYYVDAMGQGGVISHREYTSQAAAERAAASVEGQAEVNAIVMGEEYAERVADTQQHEGAARVVRSAYASMQGQGMEMPATDRAMVEEYMRLKALEQGGAQSLTPEQSRFVADFDRALARLEGDYVLRRPESIRDDISREYGVDVDDAIRKPKGGRSESEQRAVEDYANRLYGREEGPVGEIGEGEQKVQTEGSGPDGPDGPDNPLEDARRQGSEAATEERQDIINRYKQAEEAWRKLGYLWTADEDNRPLDEVIDELRQNGASDDDIDLCVEYYLANAAKNGVIDAMRHEADVRREMEIERVDRCVYRDDLLSMIPAEVDGRIVYITSGKVAVREDGTVDTAGSDQTITVCDPETGETRMVSPESIKCVYHSSDIRTKHREIRQNINSELQGEIDRLFSDEGPRADARGPLGADAPRGVAGNRDTGRADGRGGDDTAPDFSRAGEIVFTDAEGNEARGYITGHRDPETGQLEYYRAGERQLLYATDEELAAMVKEYKPDEPTPDEPTPVEPTPEVVARDSQGTELAVGDQVLQTAGRHAGARGVVEKVHPDGRVTVKYSDDNIITYDEQSGDITNTGLIKASADTDTSNPQPVLIDAAGREVKAGDTIAGPEGMTGKVTGEKYSESTYAVEWADGHVTGVNSDMLARYGYMVKDSVQDGAPDAAGINSEKEEIEKPSMDTKIEGLNEGERNVIGTITIYTSRGMAKEAKVCAKKTSDGFECEVRKDERVPVASYISIKRDMIDIVDFEESSNGDYLNKDDIANEDSGFSGILDIEDLQINKIFKNGHTGNRLAVIFRFKDGDFVSESCALLKEGVTIEDLLASHNSIMAETLKAKGLDPQLKDTVPKPPVIEESLENASTEASALARVPKDAEGRPRFEQAESAEDGWDGLVEHYAGDDFSLEDQEDMAREHAAKAIKEAQKRINDLPKLKQENGEDTRDYLMRKKRAEKAAKAELAAWEAIAKVKEQRAAQAAAAQAAAEAEAAAQAEAERQAAAQAAREKAAEEAAAQAEAARQAAEAAKGVPNWTHDRAEDARARGYRMVNGEKVERQGALQVPMGEETDVAFTDRAGDTVKGHYAIVDLDKAPVQASHMQGERNPRYFIDEAQPKDRRDQASTMKAREHARDFSVDQALSSGTAYVGPVVINSRGEVVQGNGRRDMYEQLYGDTSNAQRAESYRQALMAQAARYGVSAEDIAQMGRPMAVRVIDVDDSEAIRLGQYTAQDTESGGIERLRPRNVAMQLGGDMRRFAEMLLRSEDDEESLSQLIDRNGAGVLQWMRDRRNADGSPAGVISATQYQSAFDSRGNLTGEAKNDLQKVLWQAAFAGADSYVEQVFGRLPAKAQRAILATAHRDLDSPKREQMLEDVQKSILAYGELMSDANFAKQTEMEALLRAIEEWKNATAISDTGEIETPSEKYSNFALHLAALYRSKEYTQRMLTRLMNDIYDLVQGTVIKEGQMDFGDVDTAPKPLRDAIREKLGIEYEPAKNSVKYGEETKDEPAGGGDVAQPNGAGAPGQPGGKAPHSGGKQTETGKGRTDGGGGAAGDGPGGVGPQPPKDGVGGPGRTADTVGGDGLPEGSGKIAQAQSQRVEAKPAEAAAVKGDGYMIEPKPYTNKRGKTLDTYLVRFDQAFTKEELSAMRSKARAIKGWYDRESGGWMLRSAEDARAFAEEVMNKTPQEIEDDKPLSLGDLRQATETGQAPQQTARPPEEDSAPEVKPKGKRKWVLEGDAAEFERLRERLRTHLQGPDEVREEEAGYGKARPARMDPEVLALGCQMSALLFKGGLRSYRDYCEAMIEEVGDAIRPHLKMLYNATRGLDDIIERGWDEEMDDLKTVRSFDELNFDRQTPEAPIETAMHIADTAESLSDGAAAVEEIKRQRNERRNAPEVPSLFDPVDTIEGSAQAATEEETTAREAARESFVAEIKGRLGEPMGIKALRDTASRLSLEAKDTELQELVERALVERGREIIAEAPTEREAFEGLIELYEHQPTMGRRSSERVRLQQYSTPMPISYCMDRWLNAIAPKSGLESCAGNGMLILGIDPAIMHVNDLDDVRLGNLRRQGYAKVTRQDALRPFRARRYDIVVGNPPFGPLPAVAIDGYKIAGLEKQIMVNQLESMKDVGRGAFIIGGNMKYDKSGRVSGAELPFFNYLYSHYNVADVIDVDGGLYAKQGTRFPIRVILVNGRKAQPDTQGAPLEGSVPKVKTFDELYKRIDDDILRSEKLPDRDNSGLRGTPEQGGSGALHGGKPTVARPDTGATARTGGPSEPVPGGGGHSAGRRDDAAGPVAPRPTRVGRGDGRRAGASDNVAPDSGAGRAGAGARATGGAGGGRGAGGDAGRLVGVGGEHRPDAAVEQQTRQEMAERAAGKEARRQAVRQRLKDNPETTTVGYIPQSNAAEIGSVIPANMAEPVARALANLGDVDESVRQALGYESMTELHKALSAEQIDSVGLAISQMESGKGFIIGDMTGVGKGRQAAALIRWGVKQGHKPIFITEKAGLFTDIYRDLCDIGSGELRPLIINADSEADILTMDGDRQVVKHKAPRDSKKVKAMMRQGKVPEGYDFVVMTYSQINSDRTGEKMAYIERIAAGNILVLDESHNAGGEGKGAMFLQELFSGKRGHGKPGGVTFLSATYAKRPDNMPIYAMMTDLGGADMSSEDLVQTIRDGGVPLQEIMSRALAASGQLIRRERDFTGVTIDWVKIGTSQDRAEHRRRYDKTIDLFNQIIRFQQLYVAPAVKQRDEEVKGHGKKVGEKKGTKKGGVSNEPLFSKTFQASRQLMFALKAETIGRSIVEQIERGEKPVIAIDNTMESFADQYLPDGGVEFDEPTIGMSYLNYLNGCMRITIEDAQGNKAYDMITLDELGPQGMAEYQRLRQAIQEASDGVFASPIDRIKEIVRAAGYEIRELTGRENEIQRVGQSGRYVKVPRKDKDKKANAFDFNNGTCDALILNKSGSTGISLHASEKFNDQRQRHMTVAQPQLDINTEVQMRGRTDRTGQVHRSKYTYAICDVPAEGRLMMMLKSKLKSLDANTKSTQKGDMDTDAISDFLNMYGDKIVYDYLLENPDFNEEIYDPLHLLGENGEAKDKGKGENIPENCASKVCGYVALLPCEKQEAFYAEISARYDELIEQLNAAGENKLVITSEPLDAETKATSVMIQGSDPGVGNEFGEHSVIEECEVNILRKPMRMAEIRREQERLAAGETDAASYRDKIRRQIEAERDSEIAKKRQNMDKRNRQAAARVEAKIREAYAGAGTIDEAAIRNEVALALADIYAQNERKLQGLERATRERYDLMIQAINKVPFFQTCLVTNARAAVDYMAPRVPGYVIGVKGRTAKTMRVVSATLDGRRKVEQPLSEVLSLPRSPRTMQEARLMGVPKVEDWDSAVPTEARTTQYIVTGNLMQAFPQMPSGSRIINFTDRDGNSRQGITLPYGQEEAMKKLMGKSLVNFASLADALVSERLTLKSVGDVVTLGWNPRQGRFELLVPKTKKAGGKYFLDPDILGYVVGGDFEERGGKFVAEIAESRVADLARLLGKKHHLLSQVDQAVTAPAVQEAQAGYGSTVQSPRRRYKAQGPSLFDDAALGADAPSTVAPSGAIGRAGARGLLGADAPRGVAGGPGAAQAGLTAGAGQPTQAQRAAAELAEQKRQQAEMYRKLTPAQKSERSAEIDQEHQEVLLQIEEAGSTEQALAEGLSTLGDLWEQMAMMYGEEPTAPIPAARMVSIEADCRRIRQQLYQIAIADTSLRDELQGIEDEYLSIDYDPDRGHERSIARYNQSLERVLELQQRARHISEVHPDNADAPKTLALAQDLEGRIRRMIEDAKFDKERRDVVAQILGEEILEEQADPKEFERGPIWEPGRQVTINDIADAQWWAYRQTNDMAKRYRSSDGSRLELLEDREYGIDVCKQAIKLKQRRIKLLKELDATPEARRALDEAIRRQKEDIKIIRQWIKEGDGRGRDTRVSPLLSVSFRLLDEDPFVNPGTKAVTAYKWFRVKDGELYPAMIDNPQGAGTPRGVAIGADATGANRNADGTLRTNTRGRVSVKPRKGEKLAWRPDQHGDEQVGGEQFLVSNPATGERELIPEDLVLVECQMDMTKDYTLAALEYGTNEKGVLNYSQAGVPYITRGGGYRYRTNANPAIGTMTLSHAVKITRILDDQDYRELCGELGIQPRARRGGDIDLGRYGLERGEQVPYIPEGYDREGVDVSEEVRQLPGYRRNPIDFDHPSVRKYFEVISRDASGRVDKEKAQALLEHYRAEYEATDAKVFAEHGVNLHDDLFEVNGRVESADVRTRLGEQAETFEQRRQAAVRNRGTVMAGLNEAEVNVVHVPRHGYKGRNALTQAVDAAAKRYDGVTLKYENHGATFEYTITPRSLKYAANHSSNSENNGVHMAVMDKLDEVISESIEVMEHADVHKKDGVRSEDNGYNADTLMHRFVGAVNIDGKSYRVVTTLKEYSSDKNPGDHSYEVTKIEVLDAETPSTPNGTTTDGAASVEVAKLLNGCEIHNKTGKKILEESEQTSAQGKRVTAERMAESLGVTGRLTVVGDKEGLKGLDVYQRADAATRERMERAPGFYDHRTGQIVIVEGNNRDAEDIAATMLHETVAHHGLDALMGSAEAARELYDEIYDHLAEEERARVNERMHRSGYDSAKATEEYMGELAEKGFEDFDSTDRSIWQKFKDKVLAWLERLLSKAGVKLPDWVKLGDNELRYILWRSKQNLERRGRDRDRAGARGLLGADAPRTVAGGHWTVGAVRSRGRGCRGRGA